MRNLTFKDKKLLACAAMGLTSIEIAENMGKTKARIDNALNTIIYKMGAENRSNAVALAFMRGYFTCDGDEKLIINHDTEKV